MTFISITLRTMYIVTCITTIFISSSVFLIAKDVMYTASDLPLDAKRLVRYIRVWHLRYVRRE